MINLPNIRRAVATMLLAVWWGGFTFYALAVIPSGHQVLHSRVRQGFITQRVTEKLNWLGVVTLAVTLTEVLAARPERKRFHILSSAWLVCLIAQTALFLTHGLMDGLLDSSRMAVNGEARFYALHQCYLWAATVGWLASGLILIVVALHTNPSKSSASSTRSELNH